MIVNRFLTCAFIGICLFCFSQQTKAQVSVQDSLALVAIYNKIPALSNYGTWLNGNVSTWTGVNQVENNRVVWLSIRELLINDTIPEEICELTGLVSLNLNSCEFKGMVPACLMEMPSMQVNSLADNKLIGIEPGADFSKMTNIVGIYITNNYFTEMPDFLSITNPGFNFLEVRNNYFNFDDLLPILNDPPADFFYDYQRPVNEYQQFNVEVRDTFDFPDAAALMGGTNNSYQWKALDETVYTPTDSRFVNVYGTSLRIEGVEMRDNIAYRCEATNPNLPGLVLQTNIYRLAVTDPFLPQSITFQSDTFSYCSDPPLLLTATAMGGRTVSFVSLNDSIATVNADQTLTLNRPGIVSLQATVPADSLYHSATLTIEMTAASSVTLPSLAIAEQLPNGEGEDLILSVPYVPQLTYEWTTPTGQTDDSSALTVSPLTASGLGTYEIRITEGSCVHRTLAASINALVYGKPIIYELITPNGDGDNETFYIENLDPSLTNEVSIFNAVHQIVYHQENYRNDWDGATLPVGTYYYNVKIGEQNYKGNLYIKR